MQGLSTIITFYNGLSSLKMCIKLLQDALKAEDIYEIIVVNDNPAMNINFLEDEYSVQVLNMPENKGYAAACNYAVDHARYDTLLFMDCDIYPTGNWLQSMKKHMQIFWKRDVYPRQFMKQIPETYLDTVWEFMKLIFCCFFAMENLLHSPKKTLMFRLCLLAA